MKKLLLVALVAIAAVLPLKVRAQGEVPGQYVAALGDCQLSASQLGASVGLASCVRSSFTATGAGTTLTAASVTGIIKVGDVVVSGVGIPAGTTIVAQLTGTVGGAGTYQTSVATTASSAASTFGGIPPGATMAYLQAETATVRWRDDGAAPTTAIGGLILTTVPGILYTGNLSAIRFISTTGLLDVSFYR